MTTENEIECELHACAGKKLARQTGRQASDGQNAAFCGAANFAKQTLLTGNGNPLLFSVMVRLACKVRSRIVRAPQEFRGRKYA
jgi:hypothetical protein